MAKIIKETIIVGAFFCLVFVASRVNGEILRNEDAMARVLELEETMQKLASADTISEYEELISNLLEKSRQDIAARAQQALEEGLADVDRQYNVSRLCLNHTMAFLEGLMTREEWAFRMIDSMGKPHSGLMNGHLIWLGSYDECVAIKAVVNNSNELSYPYKGRYCTATFGKAQITSADELSMGLKIGLCLPSSCSNNDTAGLLNTILSLLPVNTSGIPSPDVSCKLDRLELDTKAIVIIIVSSTFGLVMAVATIYDVIVTHWFRKRTEKISDYEEMKDDSEKGSQFSLEKQQETNGSLKSYDAVSGIPNGVDIVKTNLKAGQKENAYKPGRLGQVLLSFSVYTNATKILSTSQPPGTLTAVNGIRFISMTWVILGHSFGDSAQIAENVATFVPKMLKRCTFQAIANATVSVDTFFTLSGLLVAYLGLKEMKKRDGAKKFKWGMFYFHRFWRLTPPYMLFLMFYVCLLKYWSDGPMWPQQGTEINDCKDTWWRNMLYINNLYDVRRQCMGWGWYLANDMQFYVLSPLMLIPLYYSKLLGSLSCAIFLLVSVVSSGVISSVNHFSPNMLFGDKMIEQYEQMYVKPWCRIGPYAVGFFAGYILYKTDCKIKIPKILNLLGWASATAIALLLLYGLYDPSGAPKQSNDVAAFYNATHRSAWGLVVCWVIVACATGNGGFVNTLLSWKALIPLSRLTYCAYLVHLPVLDVFDRSKRSLIYFSDLEEIYLFLGTVCMSYAVAFVVSLTFESPMMGLEKALLGRGKNS